MDRIGKGFLNKMTRNAIEFYSFFDAVPPIKWVVGAIVIPVTVATFIIVISWLAEWWLEIALGISFAYWILAFFSFMKRLRF